MPDNRFPPNLLSTASDVLRRAPAPRPSLAARVTARLRAHQLDRQLAVGVQAHPASALAVHQARLTSVAEREAIARTLRLHSPRPVSARGMARLRVVLSDGCGPLYRFGRGDLNGRLGAALAEL